MGEIYHHRSETASGDHEGETYIQNLDLTWTTYDDDGGTVTGTVNEKGEFIPFHDSPDGAEHYTDVPLGHD